MDFSFFEKMADADGYITDPAQIDVILAYLKENYDSKLNNYTYQLTVVNIEAVFCNKNIVILPYNKLEIRSAKLLKLKINGDNYLGFYYVTPHDVSKVEWLLSVNEKSFYCAHCNGIGNSAQNIKTMFKEYVKKIANLKTVEFEKEVLHEMV
jgi:hypothetical protein